MRNEGGYWDISISLVQERHSIYYNMMFEKYPRSKCDNTKFCQNK